MRPFPSGAISPDTQTLERKAQVQRKEMPCIGIIIPVVGALVVTDITVVITDPTPTMEAP